MIQTENKCVLLKDNTPGKVVEDSAAVLKKCSFGEGRFSVVIKKGGSR